MNARSNEEGRWNDKMSTYVLCFTRLPRIFINLRDIKKHFKQFHLFISLFPRAWEILVTQVLNQEEKSYRLVHPYAYCRKWKKKW